LVKILEKPEEFRVTVNVQGIPLTLARNGDRQRVTRVYEEWQKIEQLFGQEMSRHYFRVKTNKGMVCDIYRDMPGGGWYLSRIHD
jgi:protein-disulfide isomerase-like protein with CxxC motif